MGGKRLRLQQRRICAIYIEFCGDPTRWHIEEMHCQLLIPVWVGNGLPDLWECNFSRLYCFFQFLRVFAAVLALQLVSEYWRYFSGYIHIR